MQHRAAGILAVFSLFLLTAASNRPTAAPPRPNILLIVLDTLRVDATSIVKPDANKTPFLASLAARGAVFTRAYSTHDFTPPSHFSIMTGLRDGLGTNDDRAENGLPYQLGISGYDTFAVAANNLIGVAQMPVHRAFKRFKQPGSIIGGTTVDLIDDTTDIDMRLRMFRCNPTPHARLALYYSAERLLPIVLEEMRTAKGPYFGFVNLLDTHEPYVPDPAFYPPEKSLPPNFDGDVMTRRLGPALTNPDERVQALIKTVKFPRLVAADLSPQTLAIYRARYDATVRGLDDTLRKFFAQLEHEKLLDNTVVIITSDHGESFGEGGFLTHMLGDRGDYESTHHVPMLLWVLLFEILGRGFKHLRVSHSSPTALNRF